MDGGPPAPLSVRGIFQARIVELPFPSVGHLSNPGIEPTTPVSPVSPALAGRFFTTEPSGKQISSVMLFKEKSNMTWSNLAK